MNDDDDLEKYNAEQNAKLTTRPIDHKIQCYFCLGRGYKLSAVNKEERLECYPCAGTGYVEQGYRNYEGKIVSR
jgi:hypothetical protein